MGGAFGGLLQLLEDLGLIVQVMARHSLWLLIGSRAYDWNLDILPEGEPRFKEQRVSREALGGSAVTVAALLALPTAFGVAGAAAALIVVVLQWALFGLAQAVRSNLEQKSERQRRGEKH